MTYSQTIYFIYTTSTFLKQTNKNVGFQLLGKKICFIALLRGMCWEDHLLSAWCSGPLMPNRKLCVHVCVWERGRETVYHFMMSVTSRRDWLVFQVTKNKQAKRPKIQCVYFSYPFYLLHSESFQTFTFTVEFFDESNSTMSVKQ